MSPELLDLEGSGSLKTRPTMDSDCYALGMVIYEILSGSIPSGASNSLTVLHRAQDGKLPDRPKGEARKLFTDDIWNVITRCLRTKPSERACAKDVLRCLGGKFPAVDGDDDLCDIAATNPQHGRQDHREGDSSGFSSLIPNFA